METKYVRHVEWTLNFIFRYFTLSVCWSVTYSRLHIPWALCSTLVVLVFYKTCYSALEDPNNHGQMVWPLISFHQTTHSTTSKDNQMFFDSISKELDPQAENVFTKVVSLRFNMNILNVLDFNFYQSSNPINHF